MNINTVAVRRLRDRLLAAGSLDPASGHQVATYEPNGSVTQAVMRRIEPFAETGYITMVADGESVAAEHRALAAALSILGDGQVSTEDVEVLLSTFASRLQASGAEGRIAQIGAQLGAEREDREIAFTLAAVIALADGSVDIAENGVVEWVREYFGVSNKRVAQLLEEADS